LTIRPDMYPLGILPDAPITDSQLAALVTLERFNLSSVRDRLLADAQMPSTWVDEAIFEFRRYLGLHLVRKSGLPMFSKHVDAVWHTCLLFSRTYANLCSQVFGSFLHHEPILERYDRNTDGWTEFQTAYESLYGPLGRLWMIGRSRP
jgi:hypothetical protein